MKFTSKQLIEIKNSYDSGLNITELILGWELPIDFETISLVYDLQAGTYTKLAAQKSEHMNSFTTEIVAVLSKYLSNEMSILDCGTGEGTSLIPILKGLGISSAYAIDASISRLLWAQDNATNAKFDLKFAVSEMEHLPLGDNSVDAIFTVHALEPNGGRENFLISELKRVTKKFVFLIEPDFESASVTQKARMTRLGYIKNLDKVIKENDLTILEKISIKNNSNKFNAASLIVIEKTNNGDEESDLIWVDPIYKDGLNPFLSGLRSTIGLWYPVVNNIPLLRRTDAQYILSPPH